MAQQGSPFHREPLGPEPRFVSGSTGAVLGTLSQRKEQANMARLEGTGKDPLGRFGKGEIFDVPMYAPVTGEGERSINPVYQELLDKGYAKKVDPEDDPGRTTTQIAAAKAGVAGSSSTLADPVDAKLAAEMSTLDALAIVHTGDPNATAEDIGGGDLKPDAIKETQQDAEGQAQPSPRFLGDDRVASKDTSGSDSTSGSGSTSSAASSRTAASSASGSGSK